MTEPAAEASTHPIAPTVAEPFQPDPTMLRVGQAMELGHRGERAASRALFAEIWDEIGGEAADPFHRCAIAHAMADVQDAPSDELVWDLRALDAADHLTDERAAQGGVASPVAGFYPSLHLNLGECYRKLGDLDRARVHLERGRAAAAALDAEGYGRAVRDALERLAQRLAAG